MRCDIAQTNAQTSLQPWPIGVVRSEDSSIDHFYGNRLETIKYDLWRFTPTSENIIRKLTQTFFLFKELTDFEDMISFSQNLD